MKKLRYIFLLLIAVLSGFAISSCEDDDVVAAEVTEEAAEGSGETVKTTFTISLSAPDVSADLDPVTRAGDNANIEYAKPENGGRFQNIVVVLVGPQINTGTVRNPVYKHKIYGTHFHNWNDGVGVKEYNVIFSDVNIDKDNDLGKDFMVYAFGNLPNTLYETLPTDESGAVGNYVEDWIQFYYWCVHSNISVSDVYNINFTPNVGKYSLSYNYNGHKSGEHSHTSTGMPVNNSATATVVKGNTQFNVALKRVCARLQVTFRNFTGTYKDYDNGGAETPNNVYVDKFDLKGILATSTNYFYSSSNKLTTSTKDFDILQALGDSKTNDHIINKIENGKDLVVSMYVFENKKSTTAGAYTYDLKVDRGKSLGQQVQELQNDNVYVMWSDNLDPKEHWYDTDYSNTYNRCLGADDNDIVYNDLRMDSPDKIPYGTYTDANKYGNRVFWHYNGGKFQSCKVDLKTDECELTKKYISAPNSLKTTGTSFTCKPQKFDGFNRFYLQYNKSFGVTTTMMISNDKLKDRTFVSFENKKPYYPWVFFAKYIIKNGETFSTGTGTSKTAISQIERNHSYELDFSVMPNYETKQEILVNCVRKQNEINWSEVEK